MIAPSLKRRYSGVTSTVLRLLPRQARDVAIAGTGPLPPSVPRARLSDVVLMPRRGPRGARVWHARRNIEMLAGVALRGLLRKRLRLLFTSAAQRRHTAWTRWLIGRMDAVVATSSRSAAFLEVPHRVIPHGVDATLFAPPADRAGLRRSLGLPEDGVVLGCFGRLRPQKGTDLLVDALLAVLPRHPGAMAVLMGGVTPDQAAFVATQKARVAAAGLADRIRFEPEDRGTDIARWFGALDFYVAPPRVEGFGLTPLEAMACGVSGDRQPRRRLRGYRRRRRDRPPRPGRRRPRPRGGARRGAVGPPKLARWAAAARPHVLARHRIEDEAAALNALYGELLA